MNPDHARVADALTRWLAQNFADAQDIHIENLTFPDSGYSNETLLLDLRWTRSGAAQTLPLVARLEPRGPATTFPEYDLSLQYRCMEQLQGSAVPVPPLLGYCADRQWLGVPFFLMQRVPGKAPPENPPYHQKGWMFDLPAQEQHHIWEQAVDILAHLARTDCQQQAFSFLDHPLLGATPLAQMIAQQRAYLRWVEEQHRPLPFLHQALDWVEANQPMHEPVALCWGDAKIGNLMFEGSTCTAALDWESAHLGNPVSDLGWLLMLDLALSEAIGVPRLPGFLGREATRARWEALSGCSAEHLAYYEFFAAVKFSAIMASISRIFRTKSWIAADSDMDRRNPGSSVLALYAQQLGLDLELPESIRL